MIELQQVVDETREVVNECRIRGDMDDFRMYSEFLKRIQSKKVESWVRENYHFQSYDMSDWLWINFVDGEMP